MINIIFCIFHHNKEREIQGNIFLNNRKSTGAEIISLSCSDTQSSNSHLWLWKEEAWEAKLPLQADRADGWRAPWISCWATELTNPGGALSLMSYFEMQGCAIVEASWVKMFCRVAKSILAHRSGHCDVPPRSPLRIKGLTLPVADSAASDGELPCLRSCPSLMTAHRRLTREARCPGLVPTGLTNVSTETVQSPASSLYPSCFCPFFHMYWSQGPAPVNFLQCNLHLRASF